MGDKTQIKDYKKIETYWSIASIMKKEVHHGRKEWPPTHQTESTARDYGGEEIQ